MNTNKYKRHWRKCGWLSLAGLALLTAVASPALSEGTAAGTIIENTAHGSFENPNNTGTAIEIDSNTVTLIISEVAGINVANVGLPEEAPPADVVNDGPGQGDGVISAEDIVYFTYRITNTGNDQTQFFIPGAPSIVTNAAFQAANPIEIVSYFDGNMTTTPLSIDMPALGGTTGTIAGIPNGGSVPVDGHIDVRIPVKVDAGLIPGIDSVTVVLGNTPTVGDQNIEFNSTLPSTGNDVTTSDNPGTDNSDLLGAPAFEREGSISQQTGLGDVDYGDAPDLASGTATGDYESAPGRGPSHVVSAAPSIFLGSGVDAETTFSEDDGPPLEDDAVVVNDGSAMFPSLHNQTFLAGQAYTWDVTTAGSGNLSVWIDFNQNGSFEDADEKVVDEIVPSGAVESLPIMIPASAVSGNTYVRVRYSSQTGLTSTNAAADGEVEDYAIIIAPTAPLLRLVKRVTRIGSENFSAFVDDTGDINDGATNWPLDSPDPYVAGEIGETAEPGEEIDYTIYFLSDGNVPISNVKFCDLIPASTSYVDESLVVNLGGAGDVALSDASDVDSPAASGEKFANGAVPVDAPCPVASAEMDDGGIYVELAGPIENATGPGVPTSSFGYIRFTVQVD
ncbi:MAG: GEVED domain-containing protein [Cyanobacteria bacterium J06621_11]